MGFCDKWSEGSRCVYWELYYSVILGAGSWWSIISVMFKNFFQGCFWLWNLMEVFNSIPWKLQCHVCLVKWFLGVVKICGQCIWMVTYKLFIIYDIIYWYVLDKFITSELFIIDSFLIFCIIFQAFAIQSILLRHCLQILESWIPETGPKIIQLFKTVIGRLKLETTRELKLLSWTLIWTLILDVMMTKLK